MRSQQAKIMIAVTKAGTLQARVIPVAANEPPFEVALGGNEWVTGKGSKYQPIILEKAAALVDNLNKQLAEIEREVELRQSDTRPALKADVKEMEKADLPNHKRRSSDRLCNQPHRIRKRGA